MNKQALEGTAVRFSVFYPIPPTKMSEGILWANNCPRALARQVTAPYHVPPDGSVLAKNITLELDRASQSVGNAPPSPSTAFMNAVILERL